MGWICWSGGLTGAPRLDAHRRGAVGFLVHHELDDFWAHAASPGLPGGSSTAGADLPEPGLPGTLFIDCRKYLVEPPAGWCQKMGNLALPRNFPFSSQPGRLKGKHKQQKSFQTFVDPKHVDVLVNFKWI